jgi:hypothetical protein
MTTMATMKQMTSTTMATVTKKGWTLQDANVEDNNKDDDDNDSDQDKDDGIGGDENKWTTLRDDDGVTMDGKQLAGCRRTLHFKSYTTIDCWW